MSSTMYTNPQSTKRFPTPCRFFSQGNCRAGQECMFAHILPINGTPSNAAHAVMFGDLACESPLAQSIDTRSIEKAIRDLEVDQLEKKYRNHIKSISETHTSMDLVLEAEDQLPALKLELQIPHDYPGAHCSVVIKNKDLSEDTKRHLQQAFESHGWDQLQHHSLVQQLDWLNDHFTRLCTSSQPR